jgi:hypothetical protein
LETEISKSECSACGKVVDRTGNDNDLIVFEDPSHKVGSYKFISPEAAESQVDAFIQELEQELSTNEPIQDVKIKTITASPSKNIIYEGAFASSPIKWIDMTQNPDKILTDPDSQRDTDRRQDELSQSNPFSSYDYKVSNVPPCASDLQLIGSLKPESLINEPGRSVLPVAVIEDDVVPDDSTRLEDLAGSLLNITTEFPINGKDHTRRAINISRPSRNYDGREKLSKRQSDGSKRFMIKSVASSGLDPVYENSEILRFEAFNPPENNQRDASQSLLDHFSYGSLLLSEAVLDEEFISKDFLF